MYDWLGVTDYLRKNLLINDRSDLIYVFLIKTNFLSIYVYGKNVLLKYLKI